MGFGNLFFLPPRVTIWISSMSMTWYMHRIYAVDPAPVGPLGERMIGLFYAQRVDVDPAGVRFHVLGAGTIRYTEVDAPEVASGYQSEWSIDWYPR